MTLEQLESFIAVAAVGSFRAAANHLHVSQPTISARIQALEHRLNRQLFTRSRQGVSLTAAGRTFQRYAVTAVQTLARGRQEAMLDARYVGTVSLGVQLYLWETIVEPWVSWMTDAVPDLALRIEPDYSEGIMNLLVNGLLDLGVLFEPRLSTGIVVERLAEEPLWLVTSDPEACDGGWIDHYVGVYWGQEFDNEFARAYPLQPQPRLSFGLSSMGLAHILAHGGAAALLARSVRGLVDDGRLHRVSGSPEFTRPVFLAYRDSLVDDDHVASAIEGLTRVLATPETQTGRGR